MNLVGNTTLLISATSLLLGLVAGVVMHRSDFCIAGMFRDLFLFRRTVMLRSLFLLIVASMVLFEAARQLGILAPYPFPLLYAPSAANLLGGLLFGIGMVLAGGCVVGTLYKMGAGSVLSFTAFLGLIAGSGLYAEFHPAWASFVKATTFFAGKITLSQILDIPPLVSVLIVSVPGAVLLHRWWKQGALMRQSYATGYLQPSRAALILAALGTVSYIIIGMPLGVTSTFTKAAGYVEQVLFPEHYSTIAMFKAVPLKYVHALSGETLTGGPGPSYDALAVAQVPLILGIIAGSALSAVLVGEWRFHFRIPPQQYLLAGTGGVLMGLASRMAPTCNVWHLLGGLPILAASSILFLLGMLGGAWLGGKLLVKALATRPVEGKPAGQNRSAG